MITAAAPALAQPGRASVFTNATVLSADGAATEGVRFVVAGGAIAGMGDGAQAPPFSKTTDLAGGFVTPGLIDAHGSLGVVGRGDGPEARVADGFNAFDTVAFRDAWRQGVTAVYVSPGGAGITGVGALVRLGENEDGGIGIFDEDTEALCVNLDTGSPIERLETLHAVAQRIAAAKAYRESLEIYDEELETYKEELEKFLEERAKKDAEEEEGDEESGDAEGEEGSEEESDTSAEDKPEDKPKKEDKKNGSKDNGEADEEEENGPEKPTRPKTDRASEVVLRAVDNEIPLRVHAHRSADILNAVELAERFNLKLVIEGASEAHLVADQLGDAGIILGPRETETELASAASPRERAQALLNEKQRWTVGSGGVANASRFVLAIAQEYSPSEALARVTRGAATACGADSLGRFGPGGVADFVVWDRDPREPGARVRRVYVAGTPVYTAPGEG